MNSRPSDRSRKPRLHGLELRVSELEHGVSDPACQGIQVSSVGHALDLGNYLYDSVSILPNNFSLLS